MKNKEEIRRNMTAEKAINILKFSDRFTLIESVAAVFFAEKAINEQQKRVASIVSLKERSKLIDDEVETVICDTVIEYLEDCEVKEE